jgi:hypothetical protein
MIWGARAGIQIQQYLNWTDAPIRALDAVNPSGSPNSLWKQVDFSDFARNYDDLFIRVSKVITLPPLPDLYDLNITPGNAATLPFQRAGSFDSVHAHFCLPNGRESNVLARSVMIGEP